MGELTDLDQNYRRLESEQVIIQAEKFQGRLANEYDQDIFLGKIFRDNSQTSEVEEFIKKKFGENVVSLKGVLEALIQNKDETINWVDMGGGRGLAMRQLALTERIKDNVVMTNVDLNDLDLSGLTKPDMRYLRKKFPGITKETMRPKFLRGNAATIQLSKPAELITSVETIQYLDHPIAAMCNWYNQLADEGIAIISTEHDWSSWIRYEDTMFFSDPHPMEFVLKTLKQNDIPFAVSKNPFRYDSEPDENLKRDFVNLVIQKVANTSLMPSSPVKKIWYNPHYYKAVYYQSDLPPVEIVHSNKITPLFSQRYSEQLSNVVREGRLVTN